MRDLTNVRTDGGLARWPRANIPWSTAVPLAVVLAYGNGIWVVWLGGEAAAVERSLSPFARWVGESSMVLPVFLAAVLGALALTRHRASRSVPAARGRRPVLATALLVAAAGSLVGAAWLATNAAYDHRQESARLGATSDVPGTCEGACRARQQASYDVQLRAVGYGSAVVLAYDVVLVGWVAALRGSFTDPATV